MSRNPIELIARTLEPSGGRAWHGGPTPVGALRGVDAEAARGRPLQGRHSIWALALHIAYWNYAVRRRLEAQAGRREGPRFPRSPANWPSLPRIADEAAWRADRALLKAEHDQLIRVIRAFPAARLARRPPGGKRWSYGELILGVLVHDAYHAGQIQLLKRLLSVR
ncbi:MAG TPA: DinB family protein [Gemmatimonadales bacterium]|nr:DinB family protein [Gemmatimonadales bacterium]